MRNYWKLRLSRIYALTYLLVGVPGIRAIAQENPYIFTVNPGQQNYLSAVVGEVRGAHFHGGMDIKTGGATGLKVYAAAAILSKIKLKS